MSEKVPDSEFKAYHITGLDEVPREALKHFSKRRLFDLFEIDVSYNGHTALETVQHHRDVVKADNFYVLNYFVIIDRPNVAKEGVLVVYIAPEGSYIDAVRYPASEAANVPPSLSISNHDWLDDRTGPSPEHKELRPFKWFAVYNLLPPAKQKSFQSALFYLDDGVSPLDYDSDWDEHRDDEKRRMDRDYYCPVTLDGEEEEEKTLDRIIIQHAEYAKANNLDPVHFAVVDDTEWEENGILFIKVTKDSAVDRFRRKGPTAGEMLNWIFNGLMTWEEAKNWDSSWVGKKIVESVSDEGSEKSESHAQDGSLTQNIKQVNVYGGQSHMAPIANPSNFNPTSLQEYPSTGRQADESSQYQDGGSVVTTKPQRTRPTRQTQHYYRTKGGMELLTCHGGDSAYEIGDKFWRELGDDEELPAGVPFEDCYGIIEFEDEIVEEIDGSMLRRGKRVEKSGNEKGPSAKL